MPVEDHDNLPKKHIMTHYDYRNRLKLVEKCNLDVTQTVPSHHPSLEASDTSAVFISKSPVLNIPPRTRTAPPELVMPI